jgi:hypothetical protein
LGKTFAETGRKWQNRLYNLLDDPEQTDSLHGMSEEDRMIDLLRCKLREADAPPMPGRETGFGALRTFTLHILK